MAVNTREREVSAPAVRSKIMQADFKVNSGKERGSLRIQGQDWLCRVVAPPANLPTFEVPGFVYNNVFVNPLELVGSRLSLFAMLYDKYRFNKLKFKFVPCTGSAQVGAIGLSYDRDISDLTPPATDGGVRALLSMQDAEAGPAWCPLEANCPLSQPEEGLFVNPVVGGDERLSYQGQLYVWCLESTSKVAGTAIGDVYVEYDCDMFCPQLDQAIPVVQVQSGAAYAGNPTGANDALFYAARNNTTEPPFAGGTGDRTLMPVVEADGVSRVTLGSGTYRFTNTIQRDPGVGGSVDLATPTVTAVQPKPDQDAQQPIQFYNIQDFTSAASGTNSAQWDGYFNVPFGGAKLAQAFSDSTGAGPAAEGRLLIEQVLPTWVDLSNGVAW